MDDAICQGLTINRPAWFRDPGFLVFLNSRQSMTWHNGGMVADEWSDVVVLVDPSCTGEGPSADVIPKAIWDEMVELCRVHLGSRRKVPHYLVRITNLDADEEPEGPGHWGEDADYPVEDWKCEVASNDTRLGYWSWVAGQRLQPAGDSE